MKQDVKNVEVRLGDGCYVRMEGGVDCVRLVPMSLGATEMSGNDVD